MVLGNRETGKDVVGILKLRQNTNNERKYILRKFFSSKDHKQSERYVTTWKGYITKKRVMLNFWKKVLQTRKKRQTTQQKNAKGMRK